MTSPVLLLLVVMHAASIQGFSLHTGVALVRKDVTSVEVEDVIDLALTSSLFKLWAASRQPQIRDIAVIYSCSPDTNAITAIRWYSQYPMIHCWCYAGNNVTDIGDLFALPLGECVSDSRLIQEGWDVIEDLRIEEVHYLTDRASYVRDARMITMISCDGPLISGARPVISVISDCPAALVDKTLTSASSKRLLGSALFNIVSIQPELDHQFSIAADADSPLALHTQLVVQVLPSRGVCRGLLDGTSGTSLHCHAEEAQPDCPTAAPMRRVHSPATASSGTSYNKFSGFHGKKLVIGIVQYYPFVVYNRGSQPEFSGLCIDILEILAEKLNFRYDIRNLGWSFGTVNSDGEWTGSIRAVMDEEVDMSLTGLAITYERETVVDFTYPFFSGNQGVGALTYEPITPKLLLPLSGAVWAVFFCTVAFIAVILWCTEVTALKAKGLQWYRSNRTSFVRFKEVAVDVVAWTFLQGGSGAIATTPSKVTVSFFWLVVIVVLATYCGNLMAMLSVTVRELPYQTLSEVAADTRYLLLVYPHSATRTLFETATGGVFAALWEKIMREDPATSLNLSMNCEDLFSDERLLCTGFIPSVVIQMQRASNGQCNWGLIQEEFFPTNVGIALPEGTPFKHYFDEIIVALHEMGVLVRLKDIYFGQYLSSASCSSSVETSASPVSLGLLWPAFAAFAFGLCCGLILLFVEYLVSKKCKTPADNGPNAGQIPPVSSIETSEV